MLYRDDKIRAAMGTKNLTIEALAVKAQVTPLTISLIRRGNPARLATLKKVADALDLTMADLFEGVGIKRKSQPQKATA